jgi:hypothetical protein
LLCRADDTAPQSGQVATPEPLVSTTQRVVVSLHTAEY